MSTQSGALATAPSFDALNPYPWFAWMRQHEHVFQDPGTSIWYVFGYHDVLRVLNPPLKGTQQDPIVFSSRIPHGPERTVGQGSLIFTDPPRQRAVRDLLTSAFSPRALQDHYAARMISIIDELLDQVLDNGEMEVVTDLSYELPVLVISELLGVSREDRSAFRHWAHQYVGRIEVKDASIVNRLPELEHYFLRTLEERRKRPAEAHADLISTLVHGCPHDGRR